MSTVIACFVKFTISDGLSLVTSPDKDCIYYAILIRSQKTKPYHIQIMPSFKPNYRLNKFLIDHREVVVDYLPHVHLLPLPQIKWPIHSPGGERFYETGVWYGPLRTDIFGCEICTS